ncbi:hypothetical protein [Intestinibacter sp.]
MRNKILTLLAVILVVGIVIWRMTSNGTSNYASNNSSTTSESSETSEGGNGSDNNSNDDNITDVSEISGFTSEQGSGSNSGGDNSSNDNSNSGNNAGSKSNGNGSNTTNNNGGSNNSNNSSKISLPYTIATTGMQIKSIGQYSGDFVEDGSDKSVSNVLSIVVTNTSSKDLQYGEIKLNAGGKTATFKVTNVPSGKSVLALETSGMKYSSGTNYTYADATYAQTDMPMNSNKVSVSTDNTKVTIKNIANKDLGTVYVYYKNLDKSGAYLGGITYRVKFDNVKKGETLSQTTKHFSISNSKIVMVDTEK